MPSVRLCGIHFFLKEWPPNWNGVKSLTFQNWVFQGLDQIRDFFNCFSQEGSSETALLERSEKGGEPSRLRP